MQKHRFFPVPGTEKGSSQAEHLPCQDLFIVAFSPLFFIKPAARTAKGNLSVTEGIVVEDLHGGKGIGLKEFPDLLYGRPPVVMVPFENDLPAGQRINKGEILPALL